MILLQSQQGLLPLQKLLKNLHCMVSSLGGFWVIFTYPFLFFTPKHLVEVKNQPIGWNVTMILSAPLARRAVHTQHLFWSV